MLPDRDIKSIPLAKRILDIVLAITGILLLSPVFLIISLLVLFNYGYPIIFHQQRPGYRAKPFWINKFRTMTDTRDSNNHLLPDRERLTHLGKLLRSTSLDELPELFNVLRGEMSIVGPRPLLMQYLGRYSPEQARRHAVLPGLTGWAQVNGRNALTWEEKFTLDCWYVDHWSFWLDIRIILLTIIKALSQEGINQPGQATAEEFLGTEMTIKETSARDTLEHKVDEHEG